METATENKWFNEPDQQHNDAEPPAAPAVMMNGDEEGETDIERVLNELPNPEDYINVWKYSDNGEDRAYKNKMPVKDFSLFRLRDRFGPGRYHLDFFSRRGRAKAKRAAVRTVFIDAENTDTQSGKTDHVPAQNNVDIQSSMQAAMMPVYAMIEKLGTLIVESRAPAQDPSALLLSMTQVLKNLHDVSPPPPIAQAPALPPAADNRIKEMKEMMSLARDFTGGTGENAHLDLLDKMIDKIAVPMIDAAQAQQAQPAQPAGAEQQPTPTARSENPMKMYAAMLIQSALKGEDPGNWVGLICDRVPVDVLREIITDPVARLGELDQRASQVSGWLNQLGSYISEEIEIRISETKGGGEHENDNGKPDETKTKDAG